MINSCSIYYLKMFLHRPFRRPISRCAVRSRLISLSLVRESSRFYISCHCTWFHRCEIFIENCLVGEAACSSEDFFIHPFDEPVSIFCSVNYSHSVELFLLIISHSYSFLLFFIPFSHFLFFSIFFSFLFRGKR